MKFAAALLILALIPLQDAKKSKDPDVRRVSLKVENHPLSKIVGDLQKETGIPIEFDDAAMKRINSDDSQATIDIQDMVLSGALKLLVLPLGCDVKVIDKKKVLIVAP